MCAHNDERPTDGVCRTCERDRNGRYRRRVRLAMALLHAAEARGLAGGEAVALLQNVDYRTLQACQTNGNGIKPIPDDWESPL
ncbi:Uncharacterised protein [Mycobacteroides abscessus subsp. abscessus]|nr:Uncharacterised protein [Mycobacteroides abscessus subsp. abscessus]